MRRAASLWHPAARLRLAVRQASRRTGRRAGFSSRPLAPSPTSLERSAKGSGKRRPRPSRAMHVVSVNVGLPRRVRWKGRDVTTGIFKTPVEGHVAAPSPEPRRRPPGRPLRPRRRREGGVCLPGSSTTPSGRSSSGRSCRSAPSARTSRSTGVPLEDGGRVRRPLPHRHRRARRHPASRALLQARASLRPRGHGRAVPRQPPLRLLPRRRGRGRCRSRRRRRDTASAGPGADPGERGHARLREGSGDVATIEQLVALDALPEDWRGYFAKRLAAVTTH